MLSSDGSAGVTALIHLQIQENLRLFIVDQLELLLILVPRHGNMTDFLDVYMDLNHGSVVNFTHYL